MRKNISIVIVCFLLALPVIVSSQQVISPNGHHAQNSQAMLSWTVGEPFINTLIAGENILTQGFHQGKLTVTAIFEKRTLPFNITVYPNPANDLLYLKIEPETSQKFRYALYSMNALLLKEAPVTGSMIEISFSHYMPGSYLLKIMNEDEEIRIFKILKR
jgi:hypothetical protein